jgi:hypothetical protein
MLYCQPERCALCQLIPGSRFCLRHQARRCLDLSKRVLRAGTREALEEMARELERTAAAMERAVWVPQGFIQRLVS